jgi:hypothetical protein
LTLHSISLIFLCTYHCKEWLVDVDSLLDTVGYSEETSYTSHAHGYTVTLPPHHSSPSLHQRMHTQSQDDNHLGFLPLMQNHFNADPDPDSDPVFHLNAVPDSDPVFHINADPDPAPLQIAGKLRPPVYRPSRPPVERQRRPRHYFEPL